MQSTGRSSVGDSDFKISMLEQRCRAHSSLESKLEQGFRAHSGYEASLSSDFERKVRQMRRRSIVYIDVILWTPGFYTSNSYENLLCNNIHAPYGACEVVQSTGRSSDWASDSKISMLEQ